MGYRIYKRLRVLATKSVCSIYSPGQWNPSHHDNSMARNPAYHHPLISAPGLSYGDADQAGPLYHLLNIRKKSHSGDTGVIRYPTPILLHVYSVTILSESSVGNSY